MFFVGIVQRIFSREINILTLLHLCQKKRLLESHSTPGLKPCKMAKGKLELAASSLRLGVGPHSHWVLAPPLFCIAVPAQIKERAFLRLEYR